MTIVLKVNCESSMCNHRWNFQLYLRKTEGTNEWKLQMVENDKKSDIKTEQMNGEVEWKIEMQAMWNYFKN